MNRMQRTLYIVLSVLFGLSILHFAGVWFSYANLPRNFATTPVIFDMALFVVLTLVLLHPVIMIILGWVVTGFVKTTDVIAPNVLPSKPLRVAIITTYVAKSEPLRILERTLKSMKQVVDPAGWNHDVWVLDERVDQEDGHRVELLCRRLGVKYFTRRDKEQYHVIGSRFTPKSKGGNHNAWYDSHGFAEYDIVAQFDTDFIVRKNALLEILPHFSDSTVGWVGTPQIYTNTHHFVARGAAEQTYVFYGPFQRGRSGTGMAQMIGANHTVRVAALQQAGGYDPHLVEDLATSMSLHSYGWKSVYVPKPLAHGEGPTTLEAFFKQQFRWCKGCLDLLFTSSFRRVSKMPLKQAVFYIWLQLFYFNGLLFGVGILLMLLKFSFGWTSVRIDFAAFLTAYVPMMLMVEIIMLWVQRFNVRPKEESGLYLRARVLMIAAMPVYLWAFLSAVKDRGKHTEFEVTAKGGASVTVTISKEKSKKKWDIFTFHKILIAACLGGLVVGFTLRTLDPVNVAWALFIPFALSVIAFKPEWFELKDEFKIQSRRFIRKLKRDARNILTERKQVRSFVKQELKRIEAPSTPSVEAQPVPIPVDASEHEALLRLRLDALVLFDTSRPIE